MKTPKIQKPRGTLQKSFLRSVPINLNAEFNKIGDGDWKKGMYDAVFAWKILNKNPEQKIMQDIDQFMSDLKYFYGENHYRHFGNFPSVIRKFLKRGYPDFSIMNKRPEKVIDEFEGDKVE